jgi:hypothetical protein
MQLAGFSKPAASSSKTISSPLGVNAIAADPAVKSLFAVDVLFPGRLAVFRVNTKELAAFRAHLGTPPFLRHFQDK